MGKRVIPKKHVRPGSGRAKKQEQWAERTLTIGRMLFAVLLIYGLMTAALGSFYPVSVMSAAKAQEALQFSPALFLAGCLKTGIWLIIEYPLYHILSVLLYQTAGQTRRSGKRCSRRK